MPLFCLVTGRLNVKQEEIDEMLKEASGSDQLHRLPHHVRRETQRQVFKRWDFSMILNIEKQVYCIKNQCWDMKLLPV